MKKKGSALFFIIIIIFCVAIGFTACSKSFKKTQKFINVTDGVFKSAGYSSSSSAKSTKKSAISVQPLAFEIGASGGKFDELYSSLRGADNAEDLNDYNLNYLKGNALYQGANLAGLFKAMASVLGDEVFSNIYDLTKVGMPSSVAKLILDDYYTLYGVTREDNAISSAIQIDFKEYGDDKFAFKLAQYSKMNGVAELRFSYYDSQSVAFVATLQGNSNIDFSSYDENYESFSVVECTLAIFSKEDYINGVVDGDKQDEVILKFVKNNLGFGNHTYKELASISSGKEIGNKQAGQIGSKMSADRYINPYLGSDGNANIIVSQEYRVPDSVTEVATASIPATKKLIVPAHVVKILDAPFKYPQFVEEVVFEDPDNGSLVQIGDDDIVDIFEGEGDDGHYSYESRWNSSKYFLISYTKVKNFTLPKTVKKIEGPIYITTDMQTLDLSNYHPDYKLPEDKNGYTVSLYTSVYNRMDGMYKELGSVEKLYANGDFALQFYGQNSVNDMDPISGKMDIFEYAVTNKAEDKIYSYSPTEEIYKVLFGLASSGQGLGSAKDYGEYRGYSKISNLVDEVVFKGYDEKFDLNSALYRSVSITVDIEDFSTVYGALGKVETDKEIKLSLLLKNGQKKTEISFLNKDGQSNVVDNRMPIQTPNGAVEISQLGFKQEFYAPSVTESEISIDGETYYFAGWSFSKDCDKIDAFEGDKVINYFQNMYAVYQAATSELQYTLNGDGTYTVKVDNINADVIVIPDTYDGKSVSTLELGQYTCKKIILPTSINTANSEVIRAIAENKLDGFKGIYNIVDIEELSYLMQSQSLVEKLKTCKAAFVENGLYYLKGAVSNYFMLVSADDALTGEVYVSNQCYIVAVEFKSGVTSVVLPSGRYSNLKYIAYLKFDTLSSLSISAPVEYVGYVSGKITGRFSLGGAAGKLQLATEAFYYLDVDSLYLPAESLTEQTLADIGNAFNGETSVYLSCQYKDIEEFEFNNISDNIYIFSPTQPDFQDDGVYRYNYWHYDENMNFAIWNKE